LRRVRIALEEVVPSPSVTVNVLSPMNSTSVVAAAPGPEKSKLCRLEWSWMTSVYVPGVEMLHRLARGVLQRNRERVARADVAGEHRIVSTHRAG